jgi:hypothetical protein
MKVTVSTVLQEMKSWREETKAYLEKGEGNLEEMTSIVENQELSKEEAIVETFGALKEPYGDWHLAIGCHQQAQETDPWQ